VDGALVLMDRLDHALEDAVQEAARILWITVGEELHRALGVREKHRDLLALALQRLPTRQDAVREVRGRVRAWRAEAGGRRGGLDARESLPAVAAEAAARGVGLPTGLAGASERRPAGVTEAGADRVLVLALRAAHPRRGGAEDQDPSWTSMISSARRPCASRW